MVGDGLVRMLARIGAALGVVVWVGGCGDDGGEQVSGGGTEPSEAQTTASSEAPSGPIPISRADLGDAWPLTVDEGELDCRREVVAGLENLYVTFTVNGTVYAVNGSASAIAEDIAPIWAPSGDGFSSKSIKPLIDRGLELCA